MQLLELTSAELDFLKAPPVASDHLQQRLQQRLTQRLAATLTARLRMSIQVHACPARDTDPADATTTPVWQPDLALSTLWLTRRLGGQRVVGVASFVPRTLIHTLDETLAECWLDGTERGSLPATLAWQVSAGTIPARLELGLPPLITNMTHWAQGVIRRV